MDRRTEASRLRGVAVLVIERNRLREAIVNEEESIEMYRLLGIPAVSIAASERRLALLKVELEELTPNRRPTIPDAPIGDTDGPA
jgi:hypothetical protein